MWKICSHNLKGDFPLLSITMFFRLPHVKMNSTDQSWVLFNILKTFQAYLRVCEMKFKNICSQLHTLGDGCCRISLHMPHDESHRIQLAWRLLLCAYALSTLPRYPTAPILPSLGLHLNIILGKITFKPVTPIHYIYSSFVIYFNLKPISPCYVACYLLIYCFLYITTHYLTSLSS